MNRILLMSFLFGLATTGWAQNGPPPLPPQPSAGGNYVVNGDFAKFTPQENLWDGVDAQNILAGERRGVYAVTESGRLGSQDMALSVNFADMNGDQLPDLVTCDPAGVVRAYFNSGTKTEPKFTVAEVVPIYLAHVAKDQRWDRSLWTWPYAAPKMALFDWSRRGSLDMVVGNYCGDIFKVDNTGAGSAPSFPQPTNYQKVRIPTAKRQWGNLFSPCPYDWNGDGRPDLIVGEGSYSANAVYVLLNQASGSNGQFTEEGRYYLCYGDGREQLTPTVADWNADGKPDLIVGDRRGTVGVYLNPGDWKPGTELRLATMVNFGNNQSLGTPVAPVAADYNGDGMFDLIIGKGNGRVAVSVNAGQKGEPKFGPAVDIVGANLWSDNIRKPSSWTLDAGNNRGNLYAYISVSDEPSPGGGKILKAGYFPSPNKVFKLSELSVNGSDEDDYFRYWYDEWYPIPAHWAGESRPTDMFLLRQDLAALKVGSTYTLSFKARGKGIVNGQCTVAFLGANENKPTKFAASGTGRGAKVVKDETKEEVQETEKFTSSKNWVNVQKTFQVHFKDRNIKKMEATTLAMIEFKFSLPQYLGECEICDVQLVEKTK